MDNVTFDVFTVLKVQVEVFWIATLCSAALHGVTIQKNLT